ncbi:N-acetyl-gamma-glutamyl-phosphate reductase [Escherichia coli]|uniref:N-acetyl-gamma-glutamyl-phosphate reductase n=1 Tax=Escherichia coli TaxID=562 RepID=A0A376JNV2_ECOLX|nr:N-acetyl-gamma-glutamyl-phosphate reductase [Escherichia coli]
MASLLIAINQRSPHTSVLTLSSPRIWAISPRGILETITCRLKSGVTQAQVAQALQQAYAHKPLVRLYDKGVPALKNVVGLPFCDIGFAVQGEHLIIVATEDNLLKGAAAQAVQCAQYSFRLCGNAVSYLRVQ